MQTTGGKRMPLDDCPAGDASTSASLRIADWSVDPTTNRIRRAGEVVRLEPKAMDVLVYLVDNAGRVVSRDELMRAVWNGTVVGYDTVTGAIQKLRKALGDDSHHPRVIETISKRGYRLIAEVTRVMVPGEADAPPTATLSVPAQSTVTDPRRRSSRSLRLLVLVAGLLLIPLLGLLAHLLAPAVRNPLGPLLSGTPPPVLSASSTGSGSDAGRRAATSSDPGTASVGRSDASGVRAYDLYRQGLAALTPRSPEGVQRAQALLEAAVRAEPAFARAQAALSAAYGIEVAEWWTDDPDARIRDGLRLARRAVALSPQLPAARTALARLYREAGAFEPALEAARAAIALDPSDPEARLMLASVLTDAGNPEQARAQYPAIRRLRPLQTVRDLFHQGRTAFLLEDDATAIRHFEATFHRQADSRRIRLWLAAAYATAGRIDDARWEIVEALAADQGLSVSRIARRLHYRRAADRDRFLDALRAAGLPE
jgi:DNA-binding winged helix-turn-helix (wHTH) protein/tetratricopeptide (TPR) repeat protein